MREIFALIRNVDETILELNKYLDDCQFQKIDLPTFEKCFSGILNLPKYYLSSHTIKLPSGETVSGEFFQSLQSSSLFGLNMLSLGYIILLRYNKTYELEINGEGLREVQNTMNHFGDFQRLNFHLFRCLKLTFSGDFDLHPSATFEYESSDNSIGIRTYGSFVSIENKTLSIEKDKIGKFLNLLNSNIENSAPYSLSLSNFENSFFVNNSQAKFVNLIAALESIFNASSNQISHTFSRHLSLLVSDNESEFQENYKKIKKLYNKRSAVVHGNKKSIDNADIQFAQELCRQSIYFWIKKNCSKEELFNIFNAMGFTPVDNKSEASNYCRKRKRRKTLKKT